MNERFSAFLDGEATRDEVDATLSTLLRDDDLKASWSRQHWLRTTLRAHSGEIVTPLDTEFSSRVMAAIASDVAADDHAGAGSSKRVVSMPPRAAGSRRRRWRNMAGLAAVASATGFALLVGNPLHQDVPASSRSDMTVAATTPSHMNPAAAASQQASAAGALDGDLVDAAKAASAARPASATTRRVATTSQKRSADHWSVSDPDIADELNGYLVEHNGMARGYGLSGATPAFVRVAAYGQETAQ